MIVLCKLMTSPRKERVDLRMNQSDLNRNAYMLCGSLAKRGIMRWWHSFIGTCTETQESRTFFVEYVIVNPALGKDYPILGQHPYYKKRGIKPSYAMVKAGVFPDADGEGGKQLHAFYPITSLKAATNPLYIQMENCNYSENHIAGYVNVTQNEARHRSFMSDAGYMEWDLEVHKAVACHTGAIANRFFTALNALESFWHGEGIRTFFRGNVTLDGVTYRVDSDGSYGYADKHWGRSFNRPLFQFASGHLISSRTGKELKHSALAIDGCCPKFLGFPLKRKLMIQLTYMGEDFEFNFAKPGMFSRCKWKVKETNKRYIWHVMAQNKTAVIKISGSCMKEQMMALKYESPDGILPKRPLWASGAGIGKVEIYRRFRGGAQLIDTLTVEDAFCEYQKG